VNKLHPQLFGLNQSNRDFSKKESWGKNQFNSAFPVALACYMSSKNIDPVYLTLNNALKIIHGNIKVSDVFRTSPTPETLFFAFERDYSPYQQMVVGNLPRVDLVTMDTSFKEIAKCLNLIM
jgi:HindVP restriction endonuclease